MEKKSFTKIAKANPNGSLTYLNDNSPLCFNDTGIETHLVFRCKRELPAFASYDLLASGKTEDVALLKDYYTSHAVIIGGAKAVAVFETPTWRASPRWGKQIGHKVETIEKANKDAVQLLQHLRQQWETDKVLPSANMFISGCVGPRGDGYVVSDALASADEYAAYHSVQIKALVDAGADLITAITMTHVDEAVGVATAAIALGSPVVISFTVETDGKLPSGISLAQAIAETDKATRHNIDYYMINCAHPSHFIHLFSPLLPDSSQGQQSSATGLNRIRGVKPNASKLSHRDLDECQTLDDGNSNELAEDLVLLRTLHLQFKVFGGCCGTDARHLAAMVKALVTIET